MLLELRTYDFAPGKAMAYLDLFSKEGLPLITRHLPMAGYWLTEVGVLNRIRHAWVYHDLTDRSARRATFMADTEWTQGFLPRGMALISRQATQLLEVTACTPSVQSVLDAAGGTVAPLAVGDSLFGDDWVSLSDDANNGELSGRVIAGEDRGQQITFTREADPAAAGADEILRRCTFSPL